MNTAYVKTESELKQSENLNFVSYESRDMKDRGFLFFFLLCLAVFGVIVTFTIITLYQHQFFINNDEWNFSVKNNVHFDFEGLKIVGRYIGINAIFTIMIGIVNAYFWFHIIRSYPSFIIKLQFIVGFAVLSFFVPIAACTNPILIIAPIVSGWFLLLLYYCYRHQIKISACLVEGSLNLLDKVSGLFFYIFTYSFFGIILVTVTSIFAIFLISYTVHIANSGNLRSDVLESIPIFLRGNFGIVSLFFSMFTAIYIFSVYRYANMVVINGLVADNYLDDKNPAQIGATLWNTITNSLGSICFAALVISVIETLHALARSIRDDNDQRRDLATVILAAIAVCLLQLIGDLVEYINRYSLIFISLYGVSYWESIQMASDRFSKNGVSIILNDVVVNWLFAIPQLCAIFLGVCIGQLVTLILVQNSTTSYDIEILKPSIQIINCLLSVLIMIGATSIVLDIIPTATSTFIILLGEYPSHFQESNPKQFEQLTEYYRKRREDGFGLIPVFIII